MRIYSGTLETGTFVANPNKGKKERIGRIQLMHANNREDIKVHFILPISCTCHAVVPVETILTCLSVLSTF